MRRNVLIVAVVVLFVTMAAGFGAAADGDIQPVHVLRAALPDNAGAVLKNIAAVLTRQVQQRCGAKVVETGDAPLTIELAIEPGIGTEGFIVVDGKPGTVRIVGNDERGVLYGLGKFLRTSRYDQGGFTPSAWRGTSVPQKPIRGMYFASHFHNFYQDAPVDEIQRYVEDLGLWGYNNVMVWYDMRQFTGFNDPRAVEFRRHLRLICEAAKAIGLDVGFVVASNEGYQNAPVALRADRSAKRGDWSDDQLCPSKPEGMNRLLEAFGEMFDWWADLQPRYFLVWPYDAGGCGCAECRPWGSNGFMKAGEAVSALARKKLPNAKIIMSTWYFDEGEWRDVAKKFAQERPWTDDILSEDMRLEDYGEYALADQVVSPPQTMPGGLPMVGFPEISMYGVGVWGGFGATVLPERFEAQWNAVKARSSGGWPYSEGIYEDVHKALFSQFYWNDRPAAETLREYAAFEYSPDVVDDVLRIFAILERNHPKHQKALGGQPQAINLEDAEAAYKMVQEADAKLMPQARKAWRWRQLYLRVLLDFQRAKYHDVHIAACQAALAELIEIYHAQRAAPWVRPPLDPEVPGKSAP